jgi:Cu-processing system permease protein
MTLTIAFDLLRQAILRKWFIALGLLVTLVLVLLGASLRMDVVDGALAGTRLFGRVMGGDIAAVDVVLGPIFSFATYLIFYGFSAFLILACADFAPALLAPGRIEHMLALPVRRIELLAGTYLGVLALAIVTAVYGAGGVCVLLGVKTGVWTFRPVLAAVLMSVGFATIYAGMLVTALLVRSAALSAAVGGVLFILGIVAGQRDRILTAWDEGVTRTVFAFITGLLPRLSTLGKFAAELAGGQAVGWGGFVALLAGFVLFVLGALALAAWIFERKDY